MILDLNASAALVFLVSFLSVALLTPLLIRKLRNIKMVSPDMNKREHPLVPKIGGITIMLGFTLATLLSLMFCTGLLSVPAMLAGICTVTLISFLGLLDDVLNLRDIYRVVLPAFAALPLMVIKAGNSTMTLPLLGAVNFNLGLVSLPFVGPFTLNLYVLLLIPLGVVACSNLINLLSGFNGLEAGSGAIICATLLIAALKLGAPAEPVLLLCAMLGACLAFLLFNWHPAHIFPGNITSYAIGATVVCAVVLGNMERIGIIVLIPQIAEFFLKARTFFRAENFGEADHEGRLHYTGPICSLTHLFMKLTKPTEQMLVLELLALQMVFALIALGSMFI